MNGYTHKIFPPFMIFMLVMAVCALGFFLGTQAVPIFTGTVFVITGLLIALRVMWLWEPFLKESRSEALRSAPEGNLRILPWVILSVMDTRQRKEESRRMLDLVNLNLLMAMAGLAIYLAAGVLAIPGWVSPFDSHQELMRDINAYMQALPGDHEKIFYAMPGEITALLLRPEVYWPPLFVVLNAAIFGTVMGYGLHQRLAVTALRFTGSLFFVALVGHVMTAGLVASPFALSLPVSHGLHITGGGWGSAPALQILAGEIPQALSPLQQRLMETGLIGAAGIYIIAAAAALLFARRILRGGERMYFGFAGLAVLGVLAVCDMALANAPSIAALWLGGWNLLAVLWVRSAPQSKKKYRIRLA